MKRIASYRMLVGKLFGKQILGTQIKHRRVALIFILGK
jgi:hypothetical protein